MKKLYTLLALLLITAYSFSQAPQSFNYQAVVRDGSGEIQADFSVTVIISIIQGTIDGTEIFTETHTGTTNDFGLITLSIGSINISDFQSIDWSAGPYFLKLNVNGNTLGTTQLISVPYALYSEKSGNVFSGDYNDLTNQPTSLSIFSNDPGYLTSFTETDPVFVAHAASGVTSTLIGNWNTAYSWGSHSGLYRPIAYVPAWSEITSNPFSFVSPSNNQLLKYNSETSKWENWTANFLVAEVDGDKNNEIQDLSLSSNTLSLTGDDTSVDLLGYLDNTDNQNLSNVLSQGTDAGNNKIVNVSQLGIGTVTPQASSALEISSTTQGFLPPRMTHFQRNLIESPEAGLLIFNTTTTKLNYFNGTEWLNFDGTAATLIGAKYGGGIVFYVDGTGEHGLICTETDISSSTEWGCNGTLIDGADGIIIGTGDQNTNDIESGCTSPGTAADLCANFESGVYDDWFLPSKDELHQIYLNLQLGGFLQFGSNRYWSSSEKDKDNAWSEFLDYGGQYSIPKDYTPGYVRAIRAF